MGSKRVSRARSPPMMRSLRPSTPLRLLRKQERTRSHERVLFDSLACIMNLESTISLAPPRSTPAGPIAGSKSGDFDSFPPRTYDETPRHSHPGLALVLCIDPLLLQRTAGTHRRHIHACHPDPHLLPTNLTPCTGRNQSSSWEHDRSTVSHYVLFQPTREQID